MEYRLQRKDDSILDGEVMALDAEDRPSCQDLQTRTSESERLPFFYYAFGLFRQHGSEAL